MYSTPSGLPSKPSFAFATALPLQRGYHILYLSLYIVLLLWGGITCVTDESDFSIRLFRNLDSICQILDWI